MSLFDSGNLNKETRISPVSKRFTPLQQTQYHRFSQMPIHSSYLFHIQSVPSIFPVAPLCTDMHSFPSPPALVISLRTILNGIVAPPYFLILLQSSITLSSPLVLVPQYPDVLQGIYMFLHKYKVRQFL